MVSYKIGESGEVTSCISVSEPLFPARPAVSDRLDPPLVQSAGELVTFGLSDLAVEIHALGAGQGTSYSVDGAGDRVDARVRGVFWLGAHGASPWVMDASTVLRGEEAQESYRGRTWWGFLGGLQGYAPS
ncbi:hypothetical protein ACQEU8_35725 [Streptomyces sp. CA-250714]|uniref:hypothetical protein n=1 Tax=Streptomyces sp. CA-250714 TaxID=3240060 RepID=UPI003D941227